MSECRTCGAPILWAKTERGKNIPLDPEPREDGNLAVASVPGGFLARSITSSAPALLTGLPRHVSHFVTCPQAAQHRGAR
jgi:hypothetical protein